MITEKSVFFFVLQSGNNDCLETFETRVNSGTVKINFYVSFQVASMFNLSL